MDILGELSREYPLVYNSVRGAGISPAMKPGWIALVFIHQEEIEDLQPGHLQVVEELAEDMTNEEWRILPVLREALEDNGDLPQMFEIE